MEDLKKRIEDLEKENAQLRERLNILERARNPLSPLPVPGKQTIFANERPMSEERANINITQPSEDLLFYLKSILGYKIKREGNIITLKSVYSFCEEDCFKVEIKNGTLCFKPTDYLEEYMELFKIYVKERRSYCAFLAAVTLDLFNKETFG